MVQSLALSLDSARVIARINTPEVVAGAVRSAIPIMSTFPSCAFLKWVSPGAGGTETHRSIGSGPVVARSALRPVAAGVGLAQVSLGECPARLEWISGEPAGAGADGLVVADLAVGTLTTHVWIRFTAGVTALELNTSLVLVTVVMPGALRVTAGESISQKVRWACAAGTIVAGLTQSIFSAYSISANWYTLEVLALFAWRALMRGLTLSLALPQWVPDVVRQAFANGGLVWSNFALSVDSALFTNLRPAEVSAPLEWVSGPSPWASTDGNVVPWGAIRSVAARE